MRRRALLLLLTAGVLGVGCGGVGSRVAADGTVTVRLGVFPNITHAVGLIGVGEGIFARHFGADRLDVSYFNAGPEVVEALFADAIDASYVGPNPAINAYAQSRGTAIRVVAGATSGGSFLVTSPDITSVDDLAGRKLATPQLGNTQDVALRAWLKDNGIETDTAGGGDVSILPQANADTLNAFTAGEIDGAWVPEPWATRLVREGGGQILVDERDLWPDGAYVTTQLAVATRFLDDHPDVVKRLLLGHVEAIAFATDRGEDAKGVVNAQIEAATNEPLGADVLDAAWENLTFTVDPVSASLRLSAEHSIELGLIDDVDLAGIHDLAILNEILAERGEEEVHGL